MTFVTGPAIATLTGLPCPQCGERALLRADDTGQPGRVSCAACGAGLDAVADVIVVSDRARTIGGCCAGFRRHDLRWRDRGGADGATQFETWAQDRVVLAPGDRVSLVFPAGGAAPRRRRPPMPLMVADHTTGTIWPLVGSVPVETLRPGR